MISCEAYKALMRKVCVCVGVCVCACVHPTTTTNSVTVQATNVDILHKFNTYFTYRCYLRVQYGYIGASW